MVQTAVMDSMHPAFREEMTAQLHDWRERYAVLVLATLRMPRQRRRERLARDLDDLRERRDEVVRSLDEAAMAADVHEWNAARTRAECAWDEIQDTTAALLQRANTVR